TTYTRCNYRRNPNNLLSLFCLRCGYSQQRRRRIGSVSGSVECQPLHCLAPAHRTPATSPAASLTLDSSYSNSKGTSPSSSP
ncbi:hypothetical protein GBAR_LOCUS24276, partial [Geodia barretti]